MAIESFNENWNQMLMNITSDLTFFYANRRGQLIWLLAIRWVVLLIHMDANDFYFYFQSTFTLIR